MASSYVCSFPSAVRLYLHVYNTNDVICIKQKPKMTSEFKREIILWQIPHIVQIAYCLAYEQTNKHALYLLLVGFCPSFYMAGKH
jgi:hypothetical protein